MTKMAVIPIYGKNNKNKSLCPVTYLLTLRCAIVTRGLLVFTFTSFSVSVGTGCILVNCRPDTCDGHWCTRCKDGYYLDTTKVAVDGRHYCNKCPESCSSCDGYDDCSGCNAGRYGNLCQSSCFGCKDDICDKDSGSCINGCTDGYYRVTDGTCST